MTEIATGWSECAAVPNKGQRAVVAAVEELGERVLMQLLGIATDNGSEFLNHHLCAYCKKQRLTFTCCRVYHKNDQAHVEQKNWLPRVGGGNLLYAGENADTIAVT